MKEIRGQYLEHVQKMFVLAGDTPAAAAANAKTVLDLETRLATKSMTPVEQRDPNAIYHRMSLAELSAAAPGFPWKAYFSAVGLSEPGPTQRRPAGVFPRDRGDGEGRPAEGLEDVPALERDQRGRPVPLRGVRQRALPLLRADPPGPEGAPGPLEAGARGRGRRARRGARPALRRARLSARVQGQGARHGHEPQGRAGRPPALDRLDRPGDAQAGAAQARRDPHQDRISGHVARLHEPSGRPRLVPRQRPAGRGVRVPAQPEQDRQARRSRRVGHHDPDGRRLLQPQP